MKKGDRVITTDCVMSKLAHPPRGAIVAKGWNISGTQWWVVRWDNTDWDSKVWAVAPLPVLDRLAAI